MNYNTAGVAASSDPAPSLDALLFRRNRETIPEKDIKILLLKLFAIGVLIPKVDTTKAPFVYCAVASDDDGVYLFQKDDAFAMLMTTEGHTLSI